MDFQQIQVVNYLLFAIYVFAQLWLLRVAYQTNGRWAACLLIANMSGVGAWYCFSRGAYILAIPILIAGVFCGIMNLVYVIVNLRAALAPFLLGILAMAGAAVATGTYKFHQAFRADPGHPTTAGAAGSDGTGGAGSAGPLPAVFKPFLPNNPVFQPGGGDKLMDAAEGRASREAEVPAGTRPAGEKKPAAEGKAAEAATAAPEPPADTEMYEYTLDDGSKGFTDDLKKIPARYRGTARRRDDLPPRVPDAGTVR
jgi:hypothetical protein